MESNSSFQEDKKVVEEVKEHQKNKKLTSSELGDLFANYLGDSLSSCVIQYHLNIVEDDEIKTYLENALSASKKHLTCLENIYKKEGIPIPVGFGKSDIRTDAPRLFSDVFMAYYITQMSIAGLTTYGSALASSSRQDVIDYFKEALNDTVVIYEKGSHLLLSKGINIYPPNIPYPEKVDFVEDQSFISLLAGKNRPFTGIEIKYLQHNINTNILGKALMLAFSQVASSEELRKLFEQGAQISSRQIKQLGTFLINENLPVPKTMDAHITDSTTPPFSDKLMLYHTALANSIGIQNYGMAGAKIMRHDLHGQFAMLTADIGKFANKSLNISIERGWLEEPPTAPDRKKLAEGKE